MDLNAIWVFTRVVQAGSFSGAARLLNMPKSTVSSKVAQLERLGVTLIRRTTRRLHLTPEGTRYFEVSARAIGELTDVELGTVQAQSVPQGELRVTAPVEMGYGILGELFDKFLKANPKIELELVLTDRVLDLVAEGIDVAIRAGELKDSRLMAKKIGQGNFRLFASPGYLKKNPPPKEPRDLEAHRCLRFTSPSHNRVWDLRKGDRRVSVPIKGCFAANNQIALRDMAVSGHGIALLSSLVVNEELKRGRLVQVLPGWATGQAPIHLVYANQRFVAPKLRAFIDYLSSRVDQLLV